MADGPFMSKPKPADVLSSVYIPRKPGGKFAPKGKC